MYLQNSFPLKTVYNSEYSFAIDLPDAMDERRFVQFSTDQLHNECTQWYGHSYVDSLIKCKNVEKRKTKSEQVKEKRELLRKCRDAVNTELQKTVPLTILNGDESVSAYNRKRLAQYFEPAPPNKKRKTSHSPNFDNVEWNKDKLLSDLRQAELTSQNINWSACAREHGISSKNGGQIVKEFATLNGLNVVALSKRCMAKRERKAKKKFPGNEISIPIPPTTIFVKEEWKKLVLSGQIHIGEPCAPYAITRYMSIKGRVEMKEIKITGRKIPLEYLRKKKH